jgi:hypothetical protein
LAWLPRNRPAPNGFFAIGTIVSPRVSPTYWDTIAAILRRRTHLQSNGIVGYQDAPAFYENYDANNGFKGEWAQRVDIEWKAVCGKGFPTEGLNKGVLSGGFPRNSLFPITDQFYRDVKLGIERCAMADTRTAARNILTKSKCKQVILCGPPGTGKTHVAKRIAAELLACSSTTSSVPNPPPAQAKLSSNARFPLVSSEGSWAIVQFHPAYNYEDFVRGIRVRTESGGAPAYTTENAIFGQMAEEARNNEDKKYVLIIDEINRANLASVLGELIYALEYRDQPVDTPYELNPGDRSLVVPKNLYIIGTMNTADRSIGHIDYAVRRRFVFLPCLPDEGALDIYYAGRADGLPVAAKALFESVKNLFQDDKKCLAPDFHADDVQVGHTYFMAEDCEELALNFAYQVMPLLREYYKDGVLVPRDGEKIAVVIEKEEFNIAGASFNNGNCYTAVLALCNTQGNPPGGQAELETDEDDSPAQPQDDRNAQNDQVEQEAPESASNGTNNQWRGGHADDTECR